MAFTYIVRCNFSEPAREQAWNDWYNGPKLVQMLAKPMFRTVQRFRRASGEGRDYLALWTIDSPKAFETPEYTSDWGFFEWRPYIIDWSRDLFEGAPADERLPIDEGGALTVVSFDGASVEAAEEGRRSVDAAAPGFVWFPCAGLDRHTPLIGLRSGDVAVPVPAGQSVVYRPISAFHCAERREAS